MHLTVESTRQPGQQTRLRMLEVDIGHPDLRKSQLSRTRLQTLQDKRTIDVVLLMHAPILDTRQVWWPNEDACAALAQTLSRHPEMAGAMITLRGPLGAGKTTFARHLLRALGVSGPIKSPSYGLVESYDVPAMSIHHCDFYRFNDPREWEDAGVRDLLAGPGLKLVEWPEQAGDHLPRPDLELVIEPMPATSDASSDDDHLARRVTLIAHTQRGQELMP